MPSYSFDDALEAVRTVVQVVLTEYQELHIENFVGEDGSAYLGFHFVLDDEDNVYPAMLPMLEAYIPRWKLIAEVLWDFHLDASFRDFIDILEGEGFNVHWEILEFKVWSTR